MRPIADRTDEVALQLPPPQSNDSAAHNAGSSEADLLHGDRQRELRKFDAAIASYDRAIALDPADAVAHSRRGSVLLRQKRYHEALTSGLRATSLDPALAEGWAGLGRILGKLQQHGAAASAYRKAIAIAPDLPFVKSRLLFQQLLGCDWTDVAVLIADIDAELASGKPSARPFVWQAVASSAENLRRCAAIYSAGYPSPAAPPTTPAVPGERIRIGYLSGELRDHSISQLRAGLFESHDKSRFELIAFDNGWHDGSAVRRRIDRAMDRIVPIAALDDDRAAAAIAAQRIDILVDLNGFNGLNRLGVLARRPAAVQATLPGYPGTLGVDFIDYIIADATVVPHEHEPHYAEQAVRLPHSYQPNDRAKPIADRRFSRAECGLPDSGFVFCCFNNVYKIQPAMLDVWARILGAVDNSILWLLADNAEASANLRREAGARGIDPARLVFAPRMPLAEHLARHACADLFLDTLPCNAHATASDALWAGLPLLTCIGETFSGRVAASLLKAIGLPELIAPTIAEYEASAIRLATDPAALEQLKAKLADNRLTTPLFDTARYTRHLEAAYLAMHERSLAGLPPAPIAISAE